MLSKKLQFAKFLFPVFSVFISCVGQNAHDEEDTKGWQELRNAQGQKFATLTSDPCKPGHPEWLIHIHTPAGTQRLNILHSEAPSARIQRTHIRFDTKETPYNLQKRLCEGSPQAVTDAQHLIQKWVITAAPDCNWQLQENGWSCGLQSIKRSTAVHEINSLRKHMLRAWKRPAYLLSRRVAIAQLWAKNQNIAQTCALTKRSLADELPLIMASETWQHAVCHQDLAPEKREQLIEFALHKSIQEIERLLRLVQQNNKTGSVQVKIKEAPSRDILVTLTPQTTVNSALQDNLNDIHQNHSCWHPLFGNKLNEARTLGLLGHNSQAICTAPQGIPYVARSIQGETEFIVTNGHYKTLVLPKGDYHYTLTAIRKDRHPEQQFDSGAISWNRKRPRQIIHNTSSNARL